MPDGNPQIIHDKDQEGEHTEPKHFTRFNFEPADTLTQEAVEAFRLGHGIRKGRGQTRALCGFLVACKALKNREEKTFTWPSSKTVLDNFQANQRVRNALMGKYFHQEGPTGCNLTKRASVYRLDVMPDTGHVRQGGVNCRMA